MKKILLNLFITGVSLIATDNGLLLDAACHDYTYKLAASNQSPLLIGSSGDFAYVLADTQTIQIDKKNKTISVWLTSLASVDARHDNSAERNIFAQMASAQAAQSGLTAQDYDVAASVDRNIPYKSPRLQYDYSKNYMIIDYKNNRYADMTTIYYLCNGTVLYSSPSKQQPNWNYIAPNSLIAGAKESIIKKYNLK